MEDTQKELDELYKDGGNIVFNNVATHHIRDLNDICFGLLSAIGLAKDDKISQDAKKDLETLMQQTFIGIAASWAKDVLVAEGAVKKTTDIKAVDFLLLNDEGDVKIYWL